MTSSRPGEEGSIAVSLRELARLEEERVRRAREDEARRREDDEAARRAREREAERAWLEHARRQREDAARIAAIERAIAERARREADDEERERRHRRDVELAEASRAQDEGRIARARRAAAGGAIVAAIAVAIAGGYLGVVRPREARLAARADEAIAERDRSIADLRRDLGARDEALAAARADVGREGARASSLAADLETARRELDRLRRAKTGGRAPIPASPSLTGFSTRCDPGSRDPLCGNMGP